MEIYLGVLINEYAGSLYGPDPAVSVFALLPLFLSGSAFDVAVQKIIQIISNHRPPFNLPQGADQVRDHSYVRLFIYWRYHGNIPLIAFSKYLTQIKAFSLHKAMLESSNSMTASILNCLLFISFFQFTATQGLFISRLVRQGIVEDVSHVHKCLQVSGAQRHAFQTIDRGRIRVLARVCGTF